MTETQLRNKAELLRREADSLELEAELERKKTIAANGLEGWLGYHFESSSGLTSEFAAFHKDYSRALKKVLAGFECVNSSRNHFEGSYFFRNEKTGKFVYINYGDVRYWQDGWYNNILIRSAKCEKDYTGGSNNNVKWSEIREMAEKLTK